MRLGSNSSVLQFIDAIAIAVAQGCMLASARPVSHPSPILRLAAVRDAVAWETALLERGLAVFRQERERVPAKQRPHYTPTHRLETLQIMRLRHWSATETARRFVLHPNTIHGWLKQLRNDGPSSRLFTKPVWNRLHIADHGGQFAASFTAALEHRGITVVKGKVRQPSFNGKVERLFRTLRLWLRIAVLPVGVASLLQRRLDRYRTWYNEDRPLAALASRTPEEAWQGVDLPDPIPIRATDSDEIAVQAQRRSCRGDVALPIITIRVERKEAA